MPSLRSRRARRWPRGHWLTVALACACAAPPSPAPRPEPAAAPQPPIASVPDDAAVPPDASPPLRVVVAIEDPAALAVIERSVDGPVHVIEGLGRQDLYRAIAADVRALAAGDPLAGVGIKGNAHRLFDAGWLLQPGARFDLVGAFFRIDRIPFTPGRCGDVRLVYRLAYDTSLAGEPLSARLPLTLALVFEGAPTAADGACADAARAWQVPAAYGPAALGAHLVRRGGPLGPEALSWARLESVLLNLQAVRWPSAVLPSVGGHAHYLLRVFRPAAAGRLVPALAGNTPDVTAIRASEDKARALRAWLRDPATLAAIDRGHAQLPDELTTELAHSYTPRGLARLGNRPFRQLLRPQELADLDLSGYRTIRSPEALLRRLDTMTCGGCHQVRAIAGFHALGHDGPAVPPGAALAVPSSAHTHAELARRQAIAEALIAGQQPALDAPWPERSPEEHGASGAHCGLGDPGFADWTCAEGLECASVVGAPGDRTVGTCVHAGARDVGEPCERGDIAPRLDPRRDRVLRRAVLPCARGGTCVGSRTGFPGGMCEAPCDALPEAGTCGVIARAGFDACIVRRPLLACLDDNVGPAGLRACAADRPCRDDYICARTEAGDGDTGACIPPYFLFSLRVDGHPAAAVTAPPPAAP